MSRILYLIAVVLSYCTKAEITAPLTITLEDIQKHCDQTITINNKCDALKHKLKTMTSPESLALLGLANRYLSEHTTDPKIKADLIRDAKKQFNQAIKLAPNNVEVLMITGIFANHNQQIGILQKVIQIKPEDHLNYYLLSRLYIYNEDTHHKAISLLLNAYQNLEGDSRWYIASRLFDTYKVLGQLEQANSFRDRVLNEMKSMSANSENKLNVKRIELICSYFALSLNAMNECLKVILDLKNYNQQLAKLNIDESLKIVEAVKGVYRKILQSRDKNPAYKSQLLAILGYLPKAAKQTDRYLLTQAIFAEGNNKEAILKQVIQNKQYKKDKEQFEAMYWLTEFYVKTGQLEKAHATYLDIKQANQPLWSDRAATQLKILEQKIDGKTKR